LDTAFASLGDEPLDVFVWQQGESNQSLWFLYEAELRELIRRIRAWSNNPKLKIIINQLGPRREKAGLLSKVAMGKTKHNRSTAVFMSYWDIAFLREIQRRVALSDPNIEIVSTIDLTVKDGIHFDGTSQKEIGRRVGLVVQGSGGGPLPVAVSRDADDPKTLLLSCERVSGSVQVVDGWQQNVALSPRRGRQLPAFAEWPISISMPIQPCCFRPRISDFPSRPRYAMRTPWRSPSPRMCALAICFTGASTSEPTRPVTPVCNRASPA
jgi:hypothetical protein